MKGWALITGASEGLGQEFARLAAAEGHDVILSARQTAKLEALAQTLRADFGVAVLCLPADLSKPGAAETLWQSAEQAGCISVLVNNAGLGRNGAFADPEGWAREAESIEVNIRAAALLMKRAAVAMAAAGGGRILNVASAAGFMPGPNMAVYHATKAFLLSLSEAAAVELRGTGVSVTALCPGATETNFFAADGQHRSTILTRMPMGKPDTVARAGWAAMKAGRAVCVTGVQNKLAVLLVRLSPRWITAVATGAFLKRRS